MGDYEDVLTNLIIRWLEKRAPRGSHCKDGRFFAAEGKANGEMNGEKGRLRGIGRKMKG